MILAAQIIAAVEQGQRIKLPLMTGKQYKTLINDLDAIRYP